MPDVVALQKVLDGPVDTKLDQVASFHLLVSSVAHHPLHNIDHDLPTTVGEDAQKDVPTED